MTKTKEVRLAIPEHLHDMVWDVMDEQDMKINEAIVYILQDWKQRVFDKKVKK
jgi:hypothetical protein